MLILTCSFGLYPEREPGAKGLPEARVLFEGLASMGREGEV
jgi:hypothetical protein